VLVLLGRLGAVVGELVLVEGLGAAASRSAMARWM